jgi:hypothetical protein
MNKILKNTEKTSKIFIILLKNNNKNNYINKIFKFIIIIKDFINKTL